MPIGNSKRRISTSCTSGLPCQRRSLFRPLLKQPGLFRHAVAVRTTPLWPVSADLGGDLAGQEQGDDCEVDHSLNAKRLHVRISFSLSEGAAELLTVGEYVRETSTKRTS